MPNKQRKRSTPLIIWWKRPLYPTLFAVIPTLVFFTKSYSEVMLAETILPLLLSLGTAITLWGACISVVHDAHRSALIATPCVLYVLLANRLRNTLQLTLGVVVSLSVIILVISPSSAWAYLEPGVFAFLLQTLTGALVALAIYSKRIIRFLTKNRKSHKNLDSSESPDRSEQTQEFPRKTS